MRRALAVLRDGIGVLLTLMAAVGVWLLFTESGARLALREVAERSGYVQAEGVQGRLWGPIRFARLRYEDAFVRVVLTDAELDWALLQLLRGTVAVSQLQAGSLDVALKPADADTAPDAAQDSGALTRLPVDLDLRGIRIDRVVIRAADAPPLQFDAVALDGSWIGDRVRLAPLAAVTPWVGALQLDGSAQLRPDAVQIEALHLEGIATADLAGRQGYTEGSDLQLAWRALHWPPAGAPTLVSEQGRLHWQGSFDAWRYALEGQLAVAGERLRIDAHGQGSLGSLAAERVRVDSGHGRFDGRAELDWRDTPTLNAHGTLDGVQPQHWLAELEGELNGALEARAVLAAQPVASFSLTLQRSTLLGYPLELAATGSYAAETLRLSRFDLRSGPSRLRASGRAWPELALDARLDSSDLRSLWPALTGRAQATLTLAGPPTLPRVAGTLRADALRYAEFGAQQVALTADVDPRGDTRVDAELHGIDAGQRIDRLRLTLAGREKAHRLTLDAVAPQLRASLTADGAADIAARAWDGTLSAARLTLPELPPWTLEDAAGLKIAGADAELAPACFVSTAARACVALRPVDAVRRIAFRVEAFRLPTLDPWMPAGTRIEGQLDAHGYLDLGAAGLDDLRLELQTSALQLRSNGLPPLRLLPGQVQVREQPQGLVLSAELPFETGGLQLAAQLAPGPVFMQRALSGTLEVDVPELSWLTLLNREFQEVRGRLDARLALAGTPAAPQLSGTAQLSDAGLRLRTPGIRLERVAATLRADPTQVLQLDAEAWSDGGVLRIDGRIDPTSASDVLALNIRGENFQAVRTPDAAIWISPALDLRLVERTLQVDGRVDVPRANLTPKTIDQGVGPSADQVIVRRGEAAAAPRPLAVAADVELRLGDAVRFDGLGLKTRLTGAVRVREAEGVPTRARGELQLVGGRYKAYGQELALDTGRLLFTGGALTRPALELRATRKPRADITVGVHVRGTLERPEFSLFSTPAMPQERQLSWLVLGRAIDQSGGSADERAMVANAALSLGLSGSEWLAQRVSGTLGIDEVTIGAQPGESSDQARLTVGKYLSPRLFISYGVALFEPGQSFRLQYDIGGGFKLATETGVESGGDLLYTIER